MLSKKKADKETTVLLIIDKSGSMHDKREETIKEFNTYVKKLKGDRLPYFLTVVLFDTSVKTLIKEKPIEDVGELEHSEYDPSGWTALHDAVVEGLNSADCHRDQAICVVITDGQENSSRRNTLSDVRRAIDHFKRDHNFEFVFLGSGPDAWNQGQQLGFNWNVGVDWTSRTASANSYGTLYTATNSTATGNAISANMLKTADTKVSPDKDI